MWRVVREINAIDCIKNYYPPAKARQRFLQNQWKTPSTHQILTEISGFRPYRSLGSKRQEECIRLHPTHAGTEKMAAGGFIEQDQRNAVQRT
ncbi:MAG: hypothetical protein M0Q54_13345, partial [Pigmentiphaga sp.]|nr:hypothetical protein [Pigmentiphaga sp.]